MKKRIWVVLGSLILWSTSSMAEGDKYLCKHFVDGKQESLVGDNFSILTKTCLTKLRDRLEALDGFAPENQTNQCDRSFDGTYGGPLPGNEWLWKKVRRTLVRKEIGENVEAMDRKLSENTTISYLGCFDEVIGLATKGFIHEYKMYGKDYSYKMNVDEIDLVTNVKVDGVPVNFYFTVNENFDAAPAITEAKQ